MSRRLTPLPGFLLLALLFLIPAAALAQQAVQGRVIEGMAGAPVEGAMVVLVEGEVAVARALTAANGFFRVQAPRPGRYLLRVDRIGYGSTASEAFEVAAGAVVVRDVHADVSPVQLAGIDVASSRRCEVRPAEGLATGRVWEEARKALEAAAWTAERDLYRFAWMRYVRDVARDGRRILSEERTFRNQFAPQPFASLPAEELALNGYVLSERGTQVFYAPDAGVLLSDPFLDTHCFALESRQEEGTRLIGLRFAPIPGRRQREVTGVLWLEEEGARLRSVTYRYTNLDDRLGGQEAGGELTFRGLPNGTWIVQEWRIRMPRVAEVRNDRGGVMRYEIVGYRDEGGSVNRVTESSGALVDEAPATATLRASVTDSLGRPAPGVRVRVEGAGIEALSGPDGVVSIPGVSAGTWSVSASHPALQAFGHEGTAQDVELAQGGAVDVHLQLPSLRALALERCEPEPLAEELGVLLGRVIDDTGAPVAGAAVQASWTVVTGPGGSRAATSVLGLRQSGDGIVTQADERGVFQVCGLPRNSALRASASQGERTSATRELRFAEGENVVVTELRLRPDGSGGR